MHLQGSIWITDMLLWNCIQYVGGYVMLDSI